MVNYDYDQYSYIYILVYIYIYIYIISSSYVHLMFILCSSLFFCSLSFTLGEFRGGWWIDYMMQYDAM